VVAAGPHPILFVQIGALKFEGTDSSLFPYGSDVAEDVPVYWFRDPVDSAGDRNAQESPASRRVETTRRVELMPDVRTYVRNDLPTLEAAELEELLARLEPGLPGESPLIRSYIVGF